MSARLRVVAVALLVTSCREPAVAHRLPHRPAEVAIVRPPTVTSGTICHTSADCPERHEECVSTYYEYHCSGTKPVPPEPIPVTCVKDGYCGRGRVCADGQCRCRDDTGCRDDERCAMGQCEALRCEADDQCGAGKICRNGACNLPSCHDGVACPLGSVCNDAPAPPFEPVLVTGCGALVCNQDADCQGGYCVSGRCYPYPWRCYQEPDACQ
jgi:hypothetical protein